MNSSTTFRSALQQVIWVLVFISSVSAVATLRRQLTASRSTAVTTLVQSVSSNLLHTAAQTRTLFTH